MAGAVLQGAESIYEIKKRIGTHEETQGALQQVAHGTVEQGWDEAKVKMDSIISQNISRSEVQ
jgi:hypothetical protein